MKKLHILQTISLGVAGLTALGAFLMPFSALASQPRVYVDGVNTLTPYTANVEVSGNLGSIPANDWFDANYVQVQYGATPGLGLSTAEERILSQNFDTQFEILGLQPDTTYWYRAVAKTLGGVVKSNLFTFTTDGVVDDSDTSGSGPAVADFGSLFGNNQGSSQTTTVPPTNIAALNGRSTTRTTTTTTRRTETRDEGVEVTVLGNIIDLSIDNRGDFVSADEPVTYDIEITNLEEDEVLTNLEIVVQLPQGSDFVSSSARDGGYVFQDNEFVVLRRELEPGETEDFTVSVVMPSRFTRDTVAAGVSVDFLHSDDKYENVLLTAETFDIDEVNFNFTADDRNRNAAFAAGTGFLPNTLGEWLLITLLIVALVYVAHRYKKLSQQERKARIEALAAQQA